MFEHRKISTRILVPVLAAASNEMSSQAEGMKASVHEIMKLIRGSGKTGADRRKRGGKPRPDQPAAH